MFTWLIDPGNLTEMTLGFLCIYLMYANKINILNIRHTGAVITKLLYVSRYNATNIYDSLRLHFPKYSIPLCSLETQSFSVFLNSFLWLQELRSFNQRTVVIPKGKLVLSYWRTVNSHKLTYFSRQKIPSKQWPIIFSQMGTEASTETCNRTKHQKALIAESLEQ